VDPGGAKCSVPDGPPNSGGHQVHSDCVGVTPPGDPPGFGGHQLEAARGAHSSPQSDLLVSLS
jgi:hypothetical protein